ncbi:MAG: DNA primase [Mycoplasma sp.]|nr:DNA primase [Candidatus Hennigella equi]
MASFVEELLERADIVDIVGRFVSLHKSGANFFGLCPFHPDQNPSMSVSPKKKIFRCFSCGASGNVINFVQKFKKISYGEAIREVAKMAGYSETDINNYLSKQSKSYSPANMKLFDLNADANDLFKMLLFNADNKQYLDYLHDRKLSDDTIRKFEIGFAGKGNEKRIIYDILTDSNIPHKQIWNEDDLLKASLISINEKSSEISDYFHNRITFPIKDKNGFIVAFIARDITKDTELKYLTSRETNLFSKSNTLYNFDRVMLDKPKTLIVLEGNIDLMSLYEAGMNESQYGAVALMGTAFTQQHKNMILNTRCIENIVLWFDNDDAGKASTLKNGLQLLGLHKNMIVVNNTTTYKDVNEILVKEGKQKVLDILQSADNPRFVTYYITHTLKGLTSLNLDSKVKDVLKVVKTENNPVYTDSYINLISSITKLTPSDLKRTYDLIRGDYGSVQPTQPQKTKVVYPAIVNNMINSFRQLITLLLVDPSLSEDSYSEFECKSPDKIKIQEIQDYIYVIKSLATSSFAPTDLIPQENKLVNNLYTQKKISEASYKFLMDAIAEIQGNKQYSIAMRSTKSKCVLLVKHINACFNEVIVSQIRHDIEQGVYKGEALANAKAEVTKLQNKINNYKKNKKTKYHIA